MHNSTVKTLVILAAGRGSRFGGIKQFHPFGRLKKTLMEYNICHAIENGFNKIVFITQQAYEKELKDKVINHLPDNIENKVVFQSSSDLPQGCSLAKSRTKPLGTAHALWCARDVIKGNFVVINADDYYARQAFKLITTEAENHFSAIVAYQLKQTLSENGGVNRGICYLSENNYLLQMRECEDIQRVDNKIIGKVNNISEEDIDENILVSMNFWYFNPQIFPIIQQLLINTFKSDPTQLKTSCENECYLPDVIALLKNNHKHSTKVLTSHDAWFGVTYAADSDYVNNKLTELTNRGIFSTIERNMPVENKS